MEQYFPVLRASGLFAGMDEAALAHTLHCLGAELRCAGKNEILLLAGERPRHVGIVLSGQIHVVREDYDGNRVLVAAVGRSGIFAEALCCAGVEESPVTALAGEASVVLLLPFDRILRVCTNACTNHQTLIEQMLRLVAQKNLFLQTRMELITMKSIRAKVMRYLEAQMPKQGRELTLPLNREELADYLCVERSALSHALAKMKQEGLIDYRKNRFTVYF